jgi:hypothetical protein
MTAKNMSLHLWVITHRGVAVAGLIGTVLGLLVSAMLGSAL